MPAMTAPYAIDHSVSPGIRWGVGVAVLLLHMGGVAFLLHHAAPVRQAVAPTVMVSFISDPAAGPVSPVPAAPPPPPLRVEEAVPLLATERRVMTETAPVRMSEAPLPATPAEPASAAAAEAVAMPTEEGAGAAALPVSPPSYGAAYLNNPRPAYPLMSRRLKEQGVTLLRVEVSREGRPQQVIVERSSGSSRLDNAATLAVRDWRFVPAREGDMAVAGWVTVPINWKLEN